MFVAIGIVVKILYGVAQRVPDNPWWRLTSILFISLVTLLASLWVRSTILQSIEITTIQEMTYSDPLQVVLTMAMVFVAIVQTVASMGVLASIVGVPILITDKFRGTGPYS
jgi:formate-dependent nitrite reductase membrane component NrfD